MRYVTLLIAVLLCGCELQTIEPQTYVVNPDRLQPVVDIPIEGRYRNPDGRCVHCSWSTLLYWNDQPELADWWIKTYGGGESANGLRAKANAAGIPYSDTLSGDIEWLDWACTTGRGCLVNDRPRHVRTLLGIDPAYVPDAKAYVLDNNGPADRVLVYDRNEWIRAWRAEGGWACTPMIKPTPATPRAPLIASAK